MRAPFDWDSVKVAFVGVSGKGRAEALAVTTHIASARIQDTTVYKVVHRDVSVTRTEKLC